MQLVANYRGWKIYKTNLATNSFKCECNNLRQNDDHFKGTMKLAKQFVDSQKYGAYKSVGLSASFRSTSATAQKGA